MFIMHNLQSINTRKLDHHNIWWDDIWSLGKKDPKKVLLDLQKMERCALQWYQNSFQTENPRRHAT